MQLTNEQIQAILKGAPKGGELYHSSGAGKYEMCYPHAHNLNDLREILQLRKEVGQLLDFAKEVKKQLARNGEYAPISHIWVDSVIAGKDVEEEVKKSFPPTGEKA